MGESYGIEHRANQVSEKIIQNQNAQPSASNPNSNVFGAYEGSGGSASNTDTDRIKNFENYDTNLRKTVGNLTASGIKLDAPQDPKKNKEDNTVKKLFLLVLGLASFNAYANCPGRYFPDTGICQIQVNNGEVINYNVPPPHLPNQAATPCPPKKSSTTT